MVNALVAYALLIVGGPTGLHHAYLRRPAQAALWGWTFGFFLLGLVRDLFCIPRYVRECNGDPRAVESLEEQIKAHPKGPPRHLSRYVAQILAGWYLGAIMGCCDRLVQWVDPDADPEVHGHLLVWAGVTFGVWIVGSQGPERVSLLYAAGGALVPLIFSASQEEPAGNDVLLTACISTIASGFSRSWAPHSAQVLKQRRGRKRRCGFCWNIFKLYVAVIGFAPFLFYGIYQYGTLPLRNEKTGVRMRMPIKHMVDKVFADNESEISYLKEAFSHIYEEMQRRGVREVLDDLYKHTNRYAENEANKALETLGLPHGADAAAVRKAFRKLSIKYHPDRQMKASPEKREESAVKFEEIRKAYELLTNKK